MDTATSNAIPVNKTAGQRPAIIVVWVDPSIGEAGAHQCIKRRFETLTLLVTHWFYFDSVDSFTSYIESSNSTKLVAIMSGGMSRLLVSKYSHHVDLHGVYVFCADVEFSRTALANQTKVKGIFNAEDDLYSRLSRDLSALFVEEGIALARLDKRREAKVYYEEAKRLLSVVQATKNHDGHSKLAIELIDMRLEQLLA
jgi:hypothetical protein